MFTGLVEGRGIIRDIRSEGPSIRLIIELPEELTAAGKPGDSVALNGCCLTVVELQEKRWAFQAGEETLSKTNLGQLHVGDAVNLERPLPVGGRLGGHFVQGHVDGIGHVDSIQIEEDWATYWFRVPAHLTEQMVPKGSIAVDGVSLTLVEVEKERFSVALIPHTLEVTTLGLQKVGDPVNIETDILGKYAQKLLRGEQAPDLTRAAETESESDK